MPDLRDIIDVVTDPLYRARYGVGSVDKSRIATSGDVPGAFPVETQEDADREERRAAGYLFGRRFPTIAPTATRMVSTVRGALGEDPALGDVANDAAELGAQGYRMASEGPQPGPRPGPLGSPPIPTAAHQANALSASAMQRRRPSPTPMPAPPPPPAPYRRLR